MYPGHHAQDTPDKAAIIMAGSGETLTYRELEARANQLANLFRSRGLAPGDHIALFMENHVEMIVAMSAAERCGLFYTPVNSFLSAAEAAYIVNDSLSQLVVTTAAKFEVAGRLPALCPAVTSWLLVDADEIGTAVPAPYEPLADALAGIDSTPGT
ncbi:MAG: AMP-binding protein, partial [Jiangellaceae bacterium]